MPSPFGGLFRRLWHSPTATSWTSTATRSFSVLLVLPLLLRRLAPAEIAVWYLLSTIIGLQTLADLGFAPTFTRLIAYATGGVKSIGDLPRSTREGAPADPNWVLIERIWSTMRVIYWRVTLLALIVLATLGTWALIRPMRSLDDPARGWASWAIVLIVSGGVLWANAFAAYLQGLNHVALYRRWEAITLFGAIVTSFVVLLMGGRLLALVAANQGWALINVIRNWQLARVVDGGRFRSFRRRELDADVFGAAWPPAWRSGLGISFSRGVIYASGLIYAQVAAASALATYLLAFRAIQMVNDLSQAPFSSKIPLLARLRSEGRFEDQLRVARRAMRMTYWLYAAGFIGVGLTGPVLLDVIKSNVAFADPRLWALLGLGFFIERYGAMHIQLYSTTNHIVWHIANGVTGAIYLAVSLVLLRPLGVYAFPVGVVAGYLGFYSWYSARLVYRMFEHRFFSFERGVLLLPAAVVGLYAAIAFLG
jgi:O-antigen/teichoic acid export membrane protein